MIKRRMGWLLAGLLAAGAAGYGVLYAVRPVEVSVEAVTKSTFRKTIEEVAYISDAQQHELFSQSGGEVGRVYVKAGAAVKEGEVILELKNSQAALPISEVNVQLSQIDGQITAQNAVVTTAKTALDAAQKERARSAALLAEGGIAQVQMDAAEQLYQTALETYEGARSTLAALNGQRAAVSNLRGVQQNINKDLVVKSPKSGILLDMPWEAGEVITPGQLLLSVGSGGSMTVKADYLADDTVAMAVGQKVLITSPVLPEEGILGTVSKISPIAQEKISALGIAQRRVSVSMDAPPAKGLKPGFEVRAAVVVEEVADVLVLPQAYIRQSESRHLVWLVADGKLHEQEIRIITQDSKQAAISGLREGDLIVRALPENAKEGMAVKVVEQ